MESEVLLADLYDLACRLTKLVKGLEFDDPARQAQITLWLAYDNLCDALGVSGRPPHFLFRQ